MHYQRRKGGKCNGPPKTLGARVHNKAQIGGLPGGFHLDSFLDLPPQSVGLPQKSWHKPGSGGHSCPDTETPSPLRPLWFLFQHPRSPSFFGSQVWAHLLPQCRDACFKGNATWSDLQFGHTLDKLGVLKKDLPHLSKLLVMLPPHLHALLPGRLPEESSRHGERMCDSETAFLRPMNE